MAAAEPLEVMTDQQAEKGLLEDMARLSHDPVGWVWYAFRWGVGELEGKQPEKWQLELLQDIADGLKTPGEVVQLAVASGHDIGKSALVAWIILWALSTAEDTRGVVTANTETQLRTKTWPELGVWHRRFVGKQWFIMTATAIYSRDKGHEKNWRVDMIPWSENNSEAFAGLHNKGKRIVLLFDEASNIADVIWEVAEGATLDEGTEIIWGAFGNPTRNTGRFRECFTRFRHRWKTRQIDSRDVALSNKKRIQGWIDDWGINSDYVRVRALGQFPSASDRQFIPSDLVAAARGRHLREEEYKFAPVIIGVDPAWYGGDEFVIYWRQGLASRKLAVFAFNDDDLKMAGYIARFEDEYKADAVFIDFGYGTGIASAGKGMGRNWQLIPFAGESSRAECLNKRMEIWYEMKEWLRAGGSIEDDQTLCDDLIAPEYEVRLDGKMKLESKEDMKGRGLPSPNRADALALTFALPVVKIAKDGMRSRPGSSVANNNYDLFGPGRAAVGDRSNNSYDMFNPRR